MSERFFDSEVVCEAIQDIVELQEEVMLFAQFADFATIPQQKENLKVLRKLHEKQKNMCFRCLLVDDPDAKAMLVEVMDHFEAFGHSIDPENPLKVFDEVEVQLLDMEDDIAYAEKHGYYPGEEPGGETPPSLGQ